MPNGIPTSKNQSPEVPDNDRSEEVALEIVDAKDLIEQETLEKLVALRSVIEQQNLNREVLT
ncbi:hypothetical protein KKF55_00270 [Patescibacteria group bacterium]|nr:hypothetical protein [Patescibacteria group bacterium]